MGGGGGFSCFYGITQKLVQNAAHRRANALDENWGTSVPSAGTVPTPLEWVWSTISIVDKLIEELFIKVPFIPLSTRNEKDVYQCLFQQPFGTMMINVVLCLVAVSLVCGAYGDSYVQYPQRGEYPPELNQYQPLLQEDADSETYNREEMPYLESFEEEDEADARTHFEPLVQENKMLYFQNEEQEDREQEYRTDEKLLMRVEDDQYGGTPNYIEDKTPVYRQFVEQGFARSESSEDPAAKSASWGWWGRERGDSACVRKIRLNKKDTISQKFYDDHICLVQNGLPKNFKLNSFCRDFRPGLPLYQVMILNKQTIKTLRSDLLSHQKDFYMYKDRLPPPSTIHFDTDNRYNFIECRMTKGSTYKGSWLHNRYQAYIPRWNGAVYQIYHGCPPVTTKPGFSANGNC